MYIENITAKILRE